MELKANAIIVREHGITASNSKTQENGKSFEILTQ